MLLSFLITNDKGITFECITIGKLISYKNKCLVELKIILNSEICKQFFQNIPLNDLKETK